MKNNELFKQRLKKTGQAILQEILTPIIFLIVAALITVLLLTKAMWIAYTILAILGLVVGMIIVFLLSCFIHWLFIEPFKVQKTEHEDNNISRF